MPDLSKTWFAVVNPNAGSGKTIAEWAKAEKILTEDRIDFARQLTHCKGHAIDIVMNAVSEGYRRFIAVGGDGTAHEVLCGIMYSIDIDPELHVSDFTLAVIPIGSGNDWIKTTGVPHDTEKAVRLIEAGSFMKQDVVRVTPLPEGSSKCHYMLNIGGAGFDSRVCVVVNDRKDRGEKGKLMYFRALVETLSRLEACPIRVVADGEEIFNGDFLSIALGIGKFSGGGMRQTPYSLPDDGLLDITVIPDKPMWRIVPKLLRVFTGTLPKVSFVLSGKYRSITIEPSTDMTQPVELDGEVVCDLPVRLDTLPDMLSVLCGRKDA